MFKTLAKKLLYENKWMRFWEDKIEFPNGKEGVYSYMDRADAGPMIIPITDDGKLVVLREWRYPIKAWTWCFPFGGVEEKEDYLTAAKRELKEETGITAKEWIDLGTIHIDPGGNSQITPVYLVRQLEFHEDNKEISEIFEVHKLSIEELENKVRNNEISNGWLLAGLMKLKLFLAK